MPASRPFEIHRDDLPYCSRLGVRRLDQIDLVVIHCTELPDLATARQYGERIHHAETQTGNSGHFYVERAGRVEQWVPLERSAHHVRGYNELSVGIELDNLGRYPDWFDSRCQDMDQAYTDIQIERLLALLEWLGAQLPKLAYISSHEVLDRTKVPSSDNPGTLVWRKRDPGPRFPWDEVLDQCELKFFEPD
jgi:N-acetylmuramoyl-L-alanine amidase